MNPEDLLSQLRDLDTPAVISWWPPALGWWLLSGLLFVALLVTIYLGFSKYRRGAAVRLAKQQIQAAHQRFLDTEENAVAIFMQDINAILKRLAVKYGKASEVAALTGKGWRTYLSDVAPELSATDLEPFEYGLYQAHPTINPDEILAASDILVDRLQEAKHA